MAGPEPQLPPYVIESARSARSRCKTCRRKIDKGSLRLGGLIEGPYGPGHLWHHLRCAARRRFEQVEEAYAQQAWKAAKQPPQQVPRLEELRLLAEQAEQRQASRRELPYAEVDPSGRARCKQCGEPLAKGSLRIALGRQVEFGNQMRTTTIHVHPACVGAALGAGDCATPAEGFGDALRAHSADVDPEALRRALDEIG